MGALTAARGFSFASKAAFNPLVFRKAICPSLQGLVGNAQMVEYIVTTAIGMAFLHAGECRPRVISGHSETPPGCLLLGGRADVFRQNADIGF